MLIISHCKSAQINNCQDMFLSMSYVLEYGQPMRPYSKWFDFAWAITEQTISEYFYGFIIDSTVRTFGTYIISLPICRILNLGPVNYLGSETAIDKFCSNTHLNDWTEIPTYILSGRKVECTVIKRQAF